MATDAAARTQAGRPQLGWGVVGVIVFGAGGVGDMIWHMIFGIEQNFAALLSPTHTLIFLGGILIMTTPLRATWDTAEQGAAPSFRQFVPTLLSATMATAFIAFMFMYAYAPAQDRQSSGTLFWPPEIWGGVITWTSISGLGLSLLLAPRGKAAQ